MALVGTLIAESLRVGAVIADVALTVRKISRVEVGNVDAGQPLVWTLIEFEAADADAERLATELSRSLTAGPWYCDCRTPDETFVVFAGHIFRYRRGDRVGRAEAEKYGRDVGVPESQLDWPE
jgi:hypothetical protein